MYCVHTGFWDWLQGQNLSTPSLTRDMTYGERIHTMDEIPHEMRMFCSPANSQWLVSAVDRKQTVLQAYILFITYITNCFTFIEPYQPVIYNTFGCCSSKRVTDRHLQWLKHAIVVPRFACIADVWAEDEVNHACICTYSECVCTYCKDEFCWGTCHAVIIIIIERPTPPST